MQGADPKITAGGLEELDFDLRLVVEDVLDLLAEAAERQGLHLGGLVAHTVPARLRGDPGPLRQVLTHLVGNAVKFTERGEVLVRAELAGQGDSDLTLRVAVSDTGVGIPAAAQAGLLQPLTPADGATPRLNGGSGLAICRQLVAQMGGAITLESAPGAGSTFSFTVRLRPAALPAPARADLSGARALIVDDSPASRTLLSHMLGGWDMRPVAVGDAVAALRALRAAAAAGEPFDVAIIDVVMPEQDGLALAQAIAADPLTARLPVILVSAFSLRDFDPAAQGSGAPAFVSKPIRGSQLFGSLASALAPGGLQQASPAPPAPGLRSGRVLVAEGNAISRRVAMRMLERLGYRADGAANGREALSAAAQIVYDLVLMDCHMPEIDGFAATAAIRAREAGQRHTTIIALVADALAGEQERCLAAGMDDCLTKPITREGLLAVLDRWLPPRQPAPPVAPAGSPPFDRAAFALVLGAAPEAERELAVELIDLFLRYAPQTRDDLAQSLADGSLATVRLHAHTLKGAAANLGLAALRQRCAELEALAGGGQRAGVGAAYAALADAYDAALAALRELRVELARPAQAEREPRAPAPPPDA